MAAVVVAVQKAQKAVKAWMEAVVVAVQKAQKAVKA